MGKKRIKIKGHSIEKVSSGGGSSPESVTRIKISESAKPSRACSESGNHGIKTPVMSTLVVKALGFLVKFLVPRSKFLIYECGEKVKPNHSLP